MSKKHKYFSAVRISWESKDGEIFYERHRRTQDIISEGTQFKHIENFSMLPSHKLVRSELIKKKFIYILFVLKVNHFIHYNSRQRGPGYVNFTSSITFSVLICDATIYRLSHRDN